MSKVKEDEVKKASIIVDLQSAINELRNPSGNMYHVQTMVNRAKRNTDNLVWED
jgi:hypothetical protein